MQVFLRLMVWVTALARLFVCGRPGRDRSVDPLGTSAIPKGGSFLDSQNFRLPNVISGKSGRDLDDLAGKPPKFYIYDWPFYIDDVWPPAGTKLPNNTAYYHGFRPNNGAGEMLHADQGLFQTWQFSLYKNIMARLKVSEHRTLKPEEATAFIVPFDLGVHSYIDHLTGVPRLASPHGWLAQQLLRTYSKDKALYWKYQGHNHFVFLSVTAYQMVGIGVKTFFMQICQNCTTITIETSPTKTAIKGRTRKHWYAVPYPSSFHWYEGIKSPPWELTSQSPKRSILALFIGSVRTSQPNSNSLRRLLFDQCGREPACEWHHTRHACTGVINATDTLLLLRKAVFCPAPTGDSLTRKSLFDSLVAGCIPVLFSRASLLQYSWHLSDQDVEDVSVYIPLKAMNKGGANFIDILKNLTPEAVALKQAKIRALAPSLQYSVVPDRVGNGSDGRHWAPPLRDAADVIISRILARKTIEPIHGYSDAELMAQHDQQNEIMDNHEDYEALRSDVKDAGKKRPKGLKWKPKKKLTEGLSGVSKITAE